MDQVYASRADARDRAASTSSSSAAAPAAAPWRTRSPRPARASWCSSAATSCRRKPENWSPEAVWKELRYQTHGALARRARPRVPSLHALQRRRQHQVLGQRALPAAPRGLPGGRSIATACRRPGRSTTTRWRRTTIAPSSSTTCAGRAGDDPTEPPRGPYPYPRGAALRRAWRDIVDAAARAGTASLAAAARRAASRRAGRLPPLQHLQFVRLPHPRQERRGRLRHPARARSGRTSRCGPTRCARRLITDAAGAPGRRRSRSSATGATVRVDAPLFVVVVRRGQFRRAAAALGQRPRIPTGLANSSGWSAGATWRISRR